MDSPSRRPGRPGPGRRSEPWPVTPRRRRPLPSEQRPPQTVADAPTEPHPDLAATRPVSRRPARSQPGRPRPPRPARGRRLLRRWVRGIAIALSVVTLVVTGYGWSIYRQLGNDLVTSDVLTPSPDRPLDGSTDILLVGLDSRTDAQGNPLPQQVLDQLNAGGDEGELNTDTLILVRIPNDPAKTSTAVSIPRDSFVNIPGGYGNHKINSAYARARNDALTSLRAKGVTGTDLDKQANQAGRRELITTIESLTGATIDHYAEVNLAGFAEITRTVGGVPVCLAAPAHDVLSGADFAAGPQTLEGPAALAFVRQRHGLPRGDLDRVVRQQAFLASMAHKLLSAGTLANPATLSQLITVISRYVVLDQGWDLLGFAGQASGLSGGNITFRTIPTGRLDLPTPSDGVAVQVDPKLVKSFFTDLGAPPADPATATAATHPIVDVANGTARAGLAAAAADVLDNSGFTPGQIGNADATARSSVRATDADRAAAQQIATLLGGLPVTVDPTVAPGRVAVLLGRDYSGPTTPSDAPDTADRTPTPQPGDDAPGAPPAAPVITAGGVPCVN
ncbi:LCP family protein [Pseudonocardia sp. GCM10023141]|uniref:LCP family protein n=1 Tax=Pseudonocardia sp. GCM10023141 TaxID=3252653 RepID=UPI003615C241